MTPIPTPYRDGFWNALSARDDVNLTVYYCAAGKRDRPWDGDWQRDYQWEVLPGKNLLGWKGADASLYYNRVVRKRLAANEFDAVLVGGYNHPTMLLAIRYCIRNKIPYFLMSESHLLQPRSRRRELLKDRLVRWVVHNMTGGFPTGTLAEQYLLHYGAQPDSLARVPNVPDVRRISEEVENLRKKREQLRQELGLSQRPTVLFVGRLIPKKRAHQVIEAIAALRDEMDIDLVIVGNGPERTALEEQVRQNGLSGHVHFAGFVDPREITRWYAVADLFVLPSEETWGVVVLEALAAGVPVVVSEGVGCHPDIILDPVVGKAIQRNNPRELIEAIRRQLGRALAPEDVMAAWRIVYESLCYESLAESVADHVRLASSSVVASIPLAAR